MIRDGGQAMRELIDALGNAGADASLDAPRDPLGEYWIDVTVEGQRTEVGWRHGRGYGVYLPGPAIYGQLSPDEVIVDPHEAARRLREIAALGPVGGDGAKP